VRREVRVAAAAEIPPGASKRISLGATEVVVFNLGDRFVACRNECPHRLESLAGGPLQAGVVTCPGHGWRFDLGQNGACVEGESDVKLRMFPVRVVDGEVHVQP